MNVKIFYFGFRSCDQLRKMCETENDFENSDCEMNFEERNLREKNLAEKSRAFYSAAEK